MPLFALTIFVSAFLLFQVQPLIGKIILPWFGGTPAVWTTCMLFFQVLLLGGYGYAHGVIAALPPRRQALLHVAVLAIAVAVAAPTIMPPDSWKPDGTGAPLPLILGLLAACVGLPYLALSTTGSLLQAWFARTYPGRSPYPLYALSNAGSLLGLLTFPFIVEPTIGSEAQAQMWFWGFAAFAFLCSALAIRSGLRPAASGPVETAEPDEPALAPTWGLRLWWVTLAACGSTLLLAITNQMAIDVASVPFLWVLPLSIYLLSFILCFTTERRYPRVVFYPLLVAALAGTAAVLLAGPGVKLHTQIGVYCAGLFVLVMVCHGELYRLRPHPRYLTSFYLWLSAGGALGGVFVGVIGPIAFDQYYELHLALLATPTLALAAFLRDRRLERRGRPLVRIAVASLMLAASAVGVAAALDPVALSWVYPLVGAIAAIGAFALWYAIGTNGRETGSTTVEGGRRRWAWGLPALAIGLLGYNLAGDIRYRSEDAIAISRGFFGMLRVVDRELDDPDRAQRILYHGVIKHGFQYLGDSRQMWHTSYFAPESGVGLALTRHPARAEQRPLRIGLLGLGAGTLLTYGLPGDHIRVYEIDPDVERLSREYFTYFARTDATTEVVLGDGRLSLERESAQAYDVLILDAFSSDAIPMHLLTREAFEVYLRHLRPDGILAANLSNRHVDIRPVVKQLAEHFGQRFLWVTNYSDDERGVYSADWGLVTRNDAFADEPVVKLHLEDTSGIDTSLRMWTDDYTNLLSVLKWLRDEE